MKEPEKNHHIQPQQFEQIVELIPEMVIVINRDGYIKYANARGREHMGDVVNPEMKYGEMIGCKYYDERKSCGDSHYCDFCEIAQMVKNTTHKVMTQEIVRDVRIFDESVIKRFSISSFILEGEELIAMVIRII